MKNLIFLTLFLGFSTSLLSQTITVTNTTNYDYVVRIFGSNTPLLPLVFRVMCQHVFQSTHLMQL